MRENSARGEPGKEKEKVCEEVPRKTVATKRKCKVDLDANSRAKCIRRTNPEELFDGHKIDVYMQKHHKLLVQSNKSG